MIDVETEKDFKSPYNCTCKRCGGKVSEERTKLGITLCYRCARLVIRPYREVSVAATSLQWL